VVVEEPKREPVKVIVIGALMGLVTQTVTRVEDVGHALTGLVLPKVVCAQQELHKPQVAAQEIV
jgi:hypothetical protein